MIFGKEFLNEITMLILKYSKHKELINNLIWRLIQIFGKEGVSFLIFIICAKMLNPYEFGIYNYIMAIVFFLIMFGDFGISTATSRYVAEYNTIDKEKLKLVLFNSGFIIAALTLALLLTTLTIGKYYLGDKYVYVLYIIPLVFLAPITSLYDGIYRGLKKFKYLSRIFLIIGAFSLSFVYTLIAKYGLIGALIAQNLYYLLLFFALAAGYKDFKFAIDKNLMKKIAHYSFLVGLANIGYFLYTRIDIVILGQFGFIEEIGYYEIIQKIFKFSLMPFSIAGAVVAPDNIRLFMLKKMDQIQKRINFSFFLSLIAGIIISLLLYFLIPIFIKNFLGNYYTSDFLSIFYIFLFTIPLATIEALLATGFITALGYVRILTYTILIGGIINIILDLVFLHLFGYIGIVISTVIVHNLTNLIKFIFIYKFFYT